MDAVVPYCSCILIPLLPVSWWLVSQLVCQWLVIQNNTLLTTLQEAGGMACPILKYDTIIFKQFQQAKMTESLINENQGVLSR
jgi:hypothetical protein